MRRRVLSHVLFRIAASRRILKTGQVCNWKSRPDPFQPKSFFPHKLKTGQFFLRGGFLATMHLLGIHFFSVPNFWLLSLAWAGVLGGVYLFFLGFRMLRFKRMILNTPLSRIHSASIGLVEVTGTPVGPYILTAPVTGDPCYYYRVRAWQWVESESGKEHAWKSVLDESLYVPFFLEDSTGRVLVDPDGADLDVHRSFSDEVSLSFFHTGLVPLKVRDFLVKRGLVPQEKIKLEERIIPQDFPLFVFGTLGENPALNSWSARPHEGSLGGVAFDSGNGSARFSFRTTMRTNVPFRTASVVTKALNYIPGVQVETASYQAAGGALPVAVADRAVAVAEPAKPSLAKSAFGDYDLHPSVAISKGERHEPFAISGHSQRELVGSLAWKSAACIWGGPVVTIISLYFLAVYFQWSL
jgi:hypothetical protein